MQLIILIGDFVLEYMAKAYYHNLPTVLCKILGVYTVRYDNKETGKKVSKIMVLRLVGILYFTYL